MTGTIRGLGLLLGLMALGLIGLPSAPATETAPARAAAAPSGACLPDWQVVASPVMTASTLASVSAVGANEVWAFGTAYDQPATPLTLRWDGLNWQPIPTLGAATYTWVHGGVAAPGEAWIVGEGSNTLCCNRDTAALHGDGTNWTVLPALGGRTIALAGAAAIGFQDLWAVGYITPCSTCFRQTLIMRGGATTLTRVPSANIRSPDELNAVAVVEPQDAWAVGSYVAYGAPQQTLVERWNGTAWQVVASPNLAGQDNVLYGVTAISPTDVWAVGTGTAQGRSQPLILHWDGALWSLVTAPDLPGGGVLSAVASRGAQNVWAVGQDTTGQTVTMHWNGTIWRLVPSPDAGSNNNVHGVTVVAPDDAWAVGDYQDGGGTLRPLIMHYTTACPAFTPTPIPSATRTPSPTPTTNSTPTPSPTPTLSATATPACGWQVVPNPTVGAGLAAVDGITAADIWAVGIAGGTYTQHWDGTQWGIVLSPLPGIRDNRLYDVAAIAADDVWAVGEYEPALTHHNSLALHWDGHAWTQVPLPTTCCRLYGVDATGPNDVWAVGSQLDQTQPLALHWDGSTWSIVLTPSRPPGAFNILRDVVARTPSDVWAVGAQGMTLHWDGSSWQDVPNPLGTNWLYGVAAVAADDVWAVGTAYPGGSPQSLTGHWDGQQWTLVPSPTVPGGNNLAGVAASATGEVWAVGAYRLGSTDHTLALHWDGTAWNIVPTVDIGSGSNSLAGVTVVGADVWAVGSGNGGPLTERYRVPCGLATPTGTPSVPPSPNPTRTSVSGTSTVGVVSPTRTSVSGTSTVGVVSPSPTRTGVAGTRTVGVVSPTRTTDPSATPSPCVITFTDVDPGNPFYPYIRCLACRGIISGYPCGGPGEPCPGPYFRPNNPVTRGQTAKIVSESAGFVDVIPSTQQTFADVAPGSTFHLWIERLSIRGIIGGYPCGGPFEPCVTPGNRPYFRPNNPVTRGQLAKITSGAADWTETPTAQTFADVAVGSTFYVTVERVANRGIVGGYPCGGAGEPCIAPGNRPYFRPANNATRGQMSKIAAATFFPGCPTPARR